MKVCPSCEYQSISQWKLVLQELPVPLFKAICENCNSRIGIKEDGFFTFIWEEIVFFIMIVASLILLNVWVGLFVFILWSMVRVYIKTNGDLEVYEAS